MSTDYEKLRARRHRYDQSPKGRARHRRYNRSEKGRARSDRYEENHVVLAYEPFCGVSGYTRKIRVPRTPAAEAAALRIQGKLADFRAKQREEYRAAAAEWNEVSTRLPVRGLTPRTKDWEEAA